MTPQEKAVLSELSDRGLLNGVGDDLHQEIAAAVIEAAEANGVAQASCLPEVQFLLDRLEEFDPGEEDAEREYHGHVAPAIARLRSALSSTQCAIAVCTCRPGPCQFPSTDRLCPDCGRSIDGPTHAAYCAVVCALCDLEHPLHEDAQGFHHVIKGERVACPVTSTTGGSAA